MLENTFLCKSFDRFLITKHNKKLVIGFLIQKLSGTQIFKMTKDDLHFSVNTDRRRT
jgi:hypothetical protein